MKKGILAALVIGVLGGRALAQSRTNTVTYDYVFPTSFNASVTDPDNGQAIPFGGTSATPTQAIELPRFDPSLFPGRILVGVTYTFTAYTYGEYEVVSNQSGTATFTLSVGGTTSTDFRLRSPFGTPITLRRTTDTFWARGEFDNEDAQGGLTETLALNADQTYTGTTDLLVSQPVSGNDDANLASYIGSSPFTVNVAGRATLTVSGTASGGGPLTITQTLAPFGAVGVSITYTHIPETGTAAAATAISLAAGSIVWRRRQQKRTLGS
jgi:hypothetical protein